MKRYPQLWLYLLFFHVRIYEIDHFERLESRIPHSKQSALLAAYQLLNKQGRLHGRIGRVRSGRDTGTVTRKLPEIPPKKQMRYRVTDRPNDQPTHPPTNLTDRHRGV